MTARRISPDDLARLEREALRRAAGERLAGPEVRASACEVCGAATVRWGGLCNTCRARLRAASHSAPARNQPPARDPRPRPTEDA